MASTFTSNLALEKIGIGEQDNTWGDSQHDNQDLLDNAIAGALSKSVAGGIDVTLTKAEYTHHVLVLTGTITADINVIFPANQKRWIVTNSTAGAFTVTCKTSGGTGVVVPQNATSMIRGDDTNIIGIPFSTQDGSKNKGTDTGVADSYAIDLNPPVTALTTNLEAVFVVANAATGASTLKVDETGNVAIKKNHNDDIAAGDMPAGHLAVCRYDGTVWKLLNPALPTDFMRLSQTQTVTGDKTFSGTMAISGNATFTGEINADGPLAMGDGSELTISSGSITSTGNYHRVDTEADAASDPLTDIDDANMQDGALLLLRAENGARTVVVTHTASGNHKIVLNDGLDYSLDDTAKSILLRLQSGEWHELTRSVAVVDWTFVSAIDLTSGSPSAVTLLTGVSGLKSIDGYLDGFSTNTNNQAPLIQIGDSGGFHILNYSGNGHVNDASSGSSNAIEANGVGFLMSQQASFDAADTWEGNFTLRHMGSNIWAFECAGSGGTNLFGGHGIVTLDTELTQVRITTTGGVATIDGGTGYLRYK